MRYDFVCQACRNVSVVLVRPDADHLDWSAIRCKFCGSDKMDFVAFFRDQKAQLAELGETIRNLTERLEALERGEDPMQSIPTRSN